MHVVNFQWQSAITLFLILFLISPYSYSDNTQNNIAIPDGNTSGDSTENKIKNIIKTATSLDLSQHREWINLLHYQRDSDDSYTSNVVDNKFFISDDGKQSPESELNATIRALYATNVAQPDEHAQCRFISRYHWLKQQLKNELTQLPSISCPLYEEWRKLMPAHKATLIFPAYHLNSPSSMYGHTLLRIDPPAKDKNSDWLSMAVNFGANINNDDNSILFAFKGLSGGYPGIFIVTPYYNKIKEYNRHENRDIWEYPLNLTPDETERLVLHLWELKEVNFNYYFFDENCSYRLLELLEVARPGLELTDDFGLTAIPIDTVRSIEKANMITGIVYRPSQSTNVNYLLKQLSSEQQDYVYDLAHNADLVNDDSFNQFDEHTQNLMLETAYHYLRVKQNDEIRSSKIAANSYKILQTINQNSAFTSTNAKFTESQRPENGHLSKRLSFAAGEKAELGFAELKFRMSFHSLEDSLAGFLEGAQINLGSLTLRAYEENNGDDSNIKIQSFDLIDIFSLTPRNQFFQPLSWRVYAGLEQQIINGEEHLAGHVTAGVGHAYQPWSGGQIYGLATFRAEANSQFARDLEPALGFSTGLLQHFDFGTSHLSISGESFLNDEYRQRLDFKQNIPLARNHAISLGFLRQRQPGLMFTEAQLGYHYFFH